MPKNLSSSTAPALSRRTVFMGAGAVGAIGAITAVTGISKAVPAPELVVGSAKAETGGYQLTDHVNQYYATARI